MKSNTTNQNKLAFQLPGRKEVSRFEKIHNITFKNASEADALVAQEIAEAIRGCKAKHYVLGLATGSSPIGVYKELVRLHKEEGLSFKNVVSFNLDEYFGLKAEDKQSYHSFMHTHLFDHIDIPKDQIYIPKGDIKEEDVVAFCSAYEAKIESFGGIDFQLLGIGRTAHIGFNEPGSHINSITRIIALDPITREDAAGDFNGLNFVPIKAITMGIGSILKAKRVVLLGWGHKKADVVALTIEKEITSLYPATFLQKHPNCTFILDEEASAELTKHKTPWLVRECEWTENLVKKAIVWLSNQTQKPLLKLTNRDYNEHGLSSLIASQGQPYELNIKMFNQLQHTITGWPGGKPNHDDSNRPERANPAKKRVLIFSPHPDDDVISMGGTFARLIDQGHEVHVAYQTSGNIAVTDQEALKFIEVAENSFLKNQGNTDQLEGLKKSFNSDSIKISKDVLSVKAAVRRSECLAAARFLKLPTEQLHFLNLPFYETGKIIKNEPSAVDVKITQDLIDEIKPHQIFAAGDLADPHGTHRACLNIIFKVIEDIKVKAYMDDCRVWLYRGAWQEWDIEDIEMAVPLSPDQVIQKRNAILFHQSQKDKVMFQGKDNREFWVRAEQRNQKTASIYNQLGLAEYEAIEAFKQYFF